VITVTQTASEKIKSILSEENNPDLKLRMFVQGGGCSGFSYGFTLDDVKEEDDWDIEDNGVHVLIDTMSAQYLQGATVDYIDDLTGSQFTIKNPNATTTCGCGSSFGV
jgi:iron-sulfur cluster insertion protein